MDFKLVLILLTSVISSSLSVNIYTDNWVIARNHHQHRVARYAEEDYDSDIIELPQVPKIYAMTIESDVTNRYARTLITSKVKNMGNHSQEAVFAVILPEKAFISKFVMTIDGKDYEAYVKEKKQAKQIYDQAVASGLGAAHVAASARDSNRFTVSVNIEPSSKATFHLTYEQLLKRKDFKYELVINIHPRQPVKDLFVQVNINETLPLKFVHAPPIRSGNDIRDTSGDLYPRARIEMIDVTSAQVTFKPTIQRQKEIAELLHENVNEGLSGQFIVEYDVERNQNGGEVLLDDGYFIHFFAPSNIDPLTKNVFFIFDTSGSMFGTKIAQLKEAMRKILDELKPNDKFSLIEFNTNVKVLDINNNSYVKYPSEDITYWRTDASNENLNDFSFPSSFSVTPSIVDEAKVMINNLNAHGGTNIADALKVALHLVNIQNGNPNDLQPLIVFLTDGDANIGITNPEEMIAGLSEQNIYKTPIYCLSFGRSANRNLLQKLSLKNNGFSRHIYEGADASLQLEDFYSHISSPIMNNIIFKYVSDVKDVTKTTFPIMFNGSEIVVTGKIDKDFSTLPTVIAQCALGPINFVPEVKKPRENLERLWAYETIQQLLEKKEIAENSTEIEQKVLGIALKYSFVTPVSSLVVVKPNSTNDIDLEVGDTIQKKRRLTSRKKSQSLQHRIASPTLQRNYFATSFDLSSMVPVQPLYQTALSGRGPLLKYDDISSVVLPKSTTHSTILPTMSSTTTTELPKKEIRTIKELKQSIPWIDDIMQDNMLHTENGIYKIGINEDSPHGIICPITPKNDTGYCKHLHECPEMLPLLTTVKLFERYRCDLNGFAAICCPPAKLTAQ